ncbi:MAG: helix-turn-helix transcriptional regulator [Selenomonadaceae bacterium]|nr:helix-turn-helix transcriptional regulator [Selenomonadaceae bacterium]
MVNGILKSLRNSRELSQKDFAQALRVSQQTVASWESGRTEPSNTALKAIADYFNVSADYLLGRDVTKAPILSSKETNVLGIFDTFCLECRNFFIGVLSIVCLMCTGCFQADFDLIITREGSVVQHSKFIGNPLVIRQIEDWKTNNERANPDVKANQIVEGNLRGYEFTNHYPDVETFAKSAGDLHKANSSKNKGISRRKGWFFDTYDFDFYWTNPPLSIPPEAEFMTQTAFNAVEFNFTIQLPYAADSHNADTFDSDGRFLKWNLAPVLLHGGEKFMQARFKLWHWDKVALTAIIELLLLAATIFFFIKARTTDLEPLGKDFRFKRNVFAGLSVALAMVAAYLLLAPVTFTDADIISLAI